jgi:hypothetical protein
MKLIEVVPRVSVSILACCASEAGASQVGGVFAMVIIQLDAQRYPQNKSISMYQIVCVREDIDACRVGLCRRLGKSRRTGSIVASAIQHTIIARNAR